MAVLAADAPAANSEPFTEFYVLGPDGNASNYPKNLSVGERGRFVVGVTNHEHRDVTYTLVVELDDRVVQRRPVPVDRGATWEEQMSVTPRSAGDTVLRLSLYRGTDPSLDAAPYRSLKIEMNVSES